MDNFEKYALALMVVFGALIIGGLMAVHIAWEHKAGFLYALGAAVVVWAAGFAVLFDKPRLYGLLLADRNVTDHGFRRRTCPINFAPFTGERWHQNMKAGFILSVYFIKNNSKLRPTLNVHARFGLKEIFPCD